jgi:hypothetical protein
MAMRLGKGWLPIILVLVLSGSARAQAGSEAESGGVEVVQAQFEAYNDRNLERFLRFYAPEARIFTLWRDSTDVIKGRDEMRRRYASMSRRPEGVRAQLLSRMVAGRYVIDYERVVRPGREPDDAVAIFEVDSGLIRRVWFLEDPTGPLH